MTVKVGGTVVVGVNGLVFVVCVDFTMGVIVFRVTTVLGVRTVLVGTTGTVGGEVSLETGIVAVKFVIPVGFVV